jgi:hypothetical protein
MLVHFKQRKCRAAPRSVAKLLTKGQARRIAANVAKLLNKDGGRRIAAPGSEPKFVATVWAPKDANIGVATRPWYDSH